MSRRNSTLLKNVFVVKKIVLEFEPKINYKLEKHF